MPNPSLERTATGKALGPRNGQVSSSVARAKRLAGVSRSAQTLGLRIPRMQVLRPLSAAEYVTWVEAVVPSYAQDKVASGAWDESDALARSRQEYESLLPDGQNTKENYLYAILAEDGGQVGMLWFAVKDRGKT